MFQAKFNKQVLTVMFFMLISAAMFTYAATKEQVAKAGLIYNLTKFTVWPSAADAGASFNLCVVGGEGLGNSLEALNGKRVGERPLVLHRDLNDVDLQLCHIVFIAKGNDKFIHHALQKLTRLSVLTVSDSPGFINQGGMVGLVQDGRRIAFEVNITKVRSAGLGMHAQLLRLAKQVTGLK